MAPQPIELILARNLISSVSLAALLCDSEGAVVFFNDAAAELLGRRFDEVGRLSRDQWNARFGALEESGEIGSDDDPPLTTAARDSQPTHTRTLLRALSDVIEIELDTVPLSTVEGFKGTIVFIWRAPGGALE